MSEIKCPHCGEVFKVDEQGYAAIVAQVKTAEFDKELDKRVADEKDKALNTSPQWGHFISDILCTSDFLFFL